MGMVPKRLRLSSGKEGNRLENTEFYDKDVIIECYVMTLLKAVM